MRIYWKETPKGNNRRKAKNKPTRLGKGVCQDQCRHEGKGTATLWPWFLSLPMKGRYNRQAIRTSVRAKPPKTRGGVTPGARLKSPERWRENPEIQLHGDNLKTREAEDTLTERELPQATRSGHPEQWYSCGKGGRGAGTPVAEGAAGATQTQATSPEKHAIPSGFKYFRT